MNTLITTSGYTMVPPSGLSIVSESLQLSVTSSGNVRVSGNLGTFNAEFYNDGELLPLEIHFLQGESVILTSTNTIIFNYVYSGEPEAYVYGKAVQEYSALSGIVPLWNTTVLSGSYPKVSGGFGG